MAIDSSGLLSTGTLLEIRFALLVRTARYQVFVVSTRLVDSRSTSQQLLLLPRLLNEFGIIPHGVASNTICRA